MGVEPLPKEFIRNPYIDRRVFNPIEVYRDKPRIKNLLWDLLLDIIKRLLPNIITTHMQLKPLYTGLLTPVDNFQKLIISSQKSFGNSHAQAITVEFAYRQKGPSSYPPRTTHIFPLPYTEHFPTLIQLTSIVYFQNNQILIQYPLYTAHYS